MTSITKDISLDKFQSFIKNTYNTPKDKYFELSEMLNNIQRFGIRGLK